MAIDGLFIHYLTQEFEQSLKGGKIQKIYQPNPLDIIMQIKTRTNNFSTKSLLISASLDNSRIFLTSEKYDNPFTPNNYCMVLRKYLERGIIEDISQISNDRIIQIKIANFSEMGDETYYYLIFELMGRNSNTIITNKDFQIIDALRKLPPVDEDSRTILPHAIYKYPLQKNVINPFLVNNLLDTSDNLEGVSKSLKNYLINNNIIDVANFCQKLLKPTITKTEKKYDLACYDILQNEEKSYYSSLNEMLDFYYNNLFFIQNQTNNILEKDITRKISHLKNKLTNLLMDLDSAQESLKYTNQGIILQANLYKINKGDELVELDNFFDDSKIIIKLNPMLSPSQNLAYIFKLGKKAQTGIIKINEQITKTSGEIEYLEHIKIQISFAKQNDLDEIRKELIDNGFLKKNKTFKKLKKTPNFICIQENDFTIYVGKNNIQNDFLTNHLANRNDYFFHVKDTFGAHVILKIHDINTFLLDETIIRKCANLAGWFSKNKLSSSVEVSYTQIKNIKKIKGVFGSKVILSKYKTIFIDPVNPLI